MQLILEPNLSEATFAKGILLDGFVPLTETPSTIAEIHWRWEDEPTMKPEFLGRVAAGHTLRVPFDLKGRDIRLFLISETSEGLKSVGLIEQAEQVVFSSPARVYSGEEAIVAGEDLDPFDLINIYDDAGTSKARKADANDPTMPARAFVVEAASAGGSLVGGQHVRLFFGGNLITRTSGSPWTAGDVLYLSASSPGRITGTPPAGTGDIVQIIGTAIDGDTAIFEPDEPELVP